MLVFYPFSLFDSETTAALDYSQAEKVCDFILSHKKELK